MENALYVRAVETELARTIGAHAARRERARASRAPAAIRVSAPKARAERVGDAEALLRPAARRGPGAGRRALGRRRACPSSLPSRVTVVDQAGALLTGASTDECREPLELAVRIPQAARGRVLASNRGSARLDRRCRARARKRVGGARFHGRRSRRARASIPTFKSCAASRPTRTRTAAKACKACPAR